MPLLVGVLILLTIHVLSFANSSLAASTITYARPSSSKPSSPILALPSEYPTSYPTDPDPTCEANHGLPYLTHIAQNHIPMCDPDYSNSGFECFQTIHQDLICVGQGIQFTSQPPSIHPADLQYDENGNPIPEPPHRPFSMHCRMRNLTQERIDHPGRISALEGYRSRENWKEYMYDTGLPFQLRQWQDGDGRICNRLKNDGTINVLVRREGTANIWHKLLEMWQVKISLDAVGMSGFVKNWEISKVQVVFEDDDTGPWDDLLWPFVTGRKPVRQSELEDACLGTVILPLTGATSPFWWGVWDDLPCRESFLFRPFVEKALKYMGLDTPPRLTEDTVVTIVNRTGTSNTRQLWNIDSHAEALRKSFPGVTVQVLDFSNIDLRSQSEIIRGTDVFMGAMGAGLTHLFFLNEESTVAEILAPGAHYTGFRNLAKVRGIPYFVSHGVVEDEFVVTDEYRNGMGERGKKVEVLPTTTRVEADVLEGSTKAVEVVDETAAAKVDKVEQAVAKASEEAAKIVDETRGSYAPPDESVNGVTDGWTETPPSMAAALENEEKYERKRIRRVDRTLRKRHWQDDEYLYLSEKQFIALAAAAINAQSNRGKRMKDIYPH